MIVKWNLNIYHNAIKILKIQKLILKLTRMKLTIEKKTKKTKYLDLNESQILR